MKTVRVIGASVSGLTFARLLLARGWRVDLHVRHTGPGPALVIRPVTGELLCDVWGSGPDLMPPAHRLAERVVCLDAGGDTQVVAEEALTVRAGALRDRLLDRLRRESSSSLAVHDDPNDTNDGSWLIDARGRAGADASGSRSTCGMRTIVAAEAALLTTAIPSRSSFEAVPEGWLFVAPAGPVATVQLMLAAPTGGPAAALERALAASAFARESLGELRTPPLCWPAAPVFADPWPEDGPPRIGDAAMAFDPICGDGTGQAIRSALLAAASLDAIEAGGDFRSIRENYRRRLKLAFCGHLDSCLALYGSLQPRSLWAGELLQMSRAAAALRDGLPGPGALDYRLMGTRLVPAFA
jgi:2-polyprenyl-6-methoxyphenol hydroxylase-like FAD-dependent oxidoreductase